MTYRRAGQRGTLKRRHRWHRRRVGVCEKWRCLRAATSWMGLNERQQRLRRHGRLSRESR
eukprot:3388647-Pleurochrysis_carterae.AAC.1